MKIWINAVLVFCILSPCILAQTYAPAQHYVAASLTDESGTHEPGSHSHTVERTAPAWELPDSNGQIHSSTRMLGQPHVLIFHLGDSCLQCSEQIRTFAEHADSFKQKGVDVLAVSTDGRTELVQSLATLETPLPITMLSDGTLAMFKPFRAFDLFNDTPLHATVFVDAQGQIRWQDIGHHPFTDTELLLQTISTITTQEAETRQESETKRPTIFFNRSPRIMEFQLGRLDDERLLLVERSDSDKKYAPVYQEILSRDEMSPLLREEAINALVKLNDSNLAEELLVAISKGSKSKPKHEKEDEAEENEKPAGASQLVKMLLEQPAAELANQSGSFLAAIESENSLQRRVGYAGLIVGGKSSLAWSTSQKNRQSREWLAAISLIPVELRAAERQRVVGLMETRGPTKAALMALAQIPAEQTDTFHRAAQLIRDRKLADVAVETMLSVPVAKRDAEVSRELVEYFVGFAESTKPKARTSDSFLAAMQLVDQLMVSVPNAKAKRFRKRLNAVTVRVVKLTTVEDEMRYDVPYFAVEAGRPVQIIVDNQDFMAHNVVITRAGKLKEVAELGGAAGPGKSYLPNQRENVLFATKMIQANKKARLTFDAPAEAGEYPYVCTFPQHWSRMYGVMVVVEDLDAWLKNPVKPTDPIGNTRSLVAEWTVDDLKDELATGIRDRDDTIGAKIYAEATCLQCHKVGGSGGAVGPALDAVYSRHKNDRIAVLREILEPSHFIDKQYEQHKIQTIDGETIVGIIKSRNDKEIKVLVNLESAELTTILVDDIEQMAKASQSIMPKALMNNFTKDEIFELLSFLENAQVEADE